METLVLGSDGVARAAAILKAGGLVAFPTETVYGLGADATNTAAVERIFVAKGRPSDNPLIVHVADAPAAAALARDVPLEAKKLMAAFWPGPLTLVLRRGPHVPDAVSRGLATFGVRVPHHPLALALLKAVGAPLAAPSANTSGKPSPTAAEHVLTDLEGRIDAVLDGGPTGVGLESTVLDVTVTPPVILRPGGLSRERIEAVIGPVALASETPAPGTAPRSPGMKYRHYAPHAKLVLFTGAQPAVRAAMRERFHQLEAGGHEVGVLCSRDSAHEFPAHAVLDLGPAHESVQAAALLYSRLRALDERAVDVILAEGFSEAGLGLAVMNRLRRAAAEVIEV